MAATITKIVVPATVGPAAVAGSRTYVHDIELDGDENLAVGQRVEVRDEPGRFFAATHYRPGRRPLAAHTAAVSLIAPVRQAKPPSDCLEMYSARADSGIRRDPPIFSERSRPVLMSSKILVLLTPQSFATYSGR